MTVYQSTVNLPLIARGKVRDIYAVGDDQLLLVASDRLSAFDVVFPDPIPSKGKVLTQLSNWWFSRTAGLVENHVISMQPAQDVGAVAEAVELRGRSVLCRRCKPLPVECVVRGYLEGSAFNDYQRNGSVSGVQLPPNLRRREALQHAIFTPSTKAEAGHDEPISFDRVVELVGVSVAEQIRYLSVRLYQFAHAELLKKGIVLSDTKFEFGLLGDRVILIDEILTPDSSRFWEAETYRPGVEARSMDKQYVRDYVESIGWDKKPPAPNLPQEVIAGMTRRYEEIYQRITGTLLPEGDE